MHIAYHYYLQYIHLWFSPHENVKEALSFDGFFQLVIVITDILFYRS